MTAAHHTSIPYDGSLPSLQVESRYPTNERTKIGTQTRTTPMVPQYTHACYNTAGSLNKNDNPHADAWSCSGKTSGSVQAQSIGNTVRFRKAATEDNPSPDAYQIKPFLGEQPNARCRTYPAKSFGLLGERAIDPHRDSHLRPGPASYGIEKVGVDAIGASLKSARHATPPTVGFTQGSRMDSPLVLSPGPAAYTLP